LLQLGYSPRPDSAASPDDYAKWLERFSRPITLLPPHSMNHPDISHKGNLQAGSETSSNWSGFEAHSGSRSYVAVESQWYVPEIFTGEPDNVTWSSTWVGLDGDGTADLVQAGTNQEYIDIGLFSYPDYAAWTELLPNQQAEQGVSLSPNAGDEMYVEVWVGNSNGALDQHGVHAWFFLYDQTQRQAVELSTPFDGTYFNGSEAEWIMERPTLISGSSKVLAELSEYLIDGFSESYVLPASAASWTPFGEVQNRQITMYNEYANHPDNNELSVATAESSGTGILFGWLNFH
jgi:Peptidase A4 family